MQADEIYEDTRARLTAFVRELHDDDLARAVPTCPGWSVRDLVAHLAGLAADLAGGRTEGMATAAWTARQVGERTGRSLGELLDEWAEHAPALGRLLAEMTRVVPPVIDIVTHEDDIRAALGAPPVLDAVGFDYALQAYVLGLDHRLRKNHVPALRIRAGDEVWEVGEGEPTATWDTTPYELFRTLAGRRSASHVRADRWDGDASPYVPVLSTFGALP